jgi:hypothetical protein
VDDQCVLYCEFQSVYFIFFFFVIIFISFLCEFFFLTKVSNYGLCDHCYAQSQKCVESCDTEHYITNEISEKCHEKTCEELQPDNVDVCVFLESFFFFLIFFYILYYIYICNNYFYLIFLLQGVISCMFGCLVLGDACVFECEDGYHPSDDLGKCLPYCDHDEVC